MKVCVVTGATGGIGRWIALGLARAGNRVVVVGRDRGRGEAALAWIGERSAGASLELEIADLSSLAETRRVGEAIAFRHPAVAVLVNNAGVFCARREVTAEGHERVIAVNHLSPFLLTETLLPALKRAAAATGEARIVNTGSSTADRATIDPDDLEGLRRWGFVRAYSQSKLALTMATFEWARRLNGSGVVSNVVHPGAVATGLVQARGPIGLGWRVMAPFLLSEEQGADTPLHVATAPEFATITGAYVKKRQVVKPNRLALDPELVARVWGATVRLAGVEAGAG